VVLEDAQAELKQSSTIHSRLSSDLKQRLTFVDEANTQTTASTRKKTVAGMPVVSRQK
jgi:hypothetical protein